MKIEICANSVQSAVNAQEGGAHRIELCCNLQEGGLTPSAGTIQLVRKWLAIEVFVLIRPRIGGFCYSGIEMETMMKDIIFCKEQGIDGVVFGVLKKDNTIDIERNTILLEAAKPMQATFHRAFDCLPNPFKGVEQLVALGFDRILTSGQATTAISGQAIIKDLVHQANHQIILLPGGGLNSSNTTDFIAQTGVQEIHLSAKKKIVNGKDSLFEATCFETDTEEVRNVVELLKKIT